MSVYYHSTYLVCICWYCSYLGNSIRFSFFFLSDSLSFLHLCDDYISIFLLFCVLYYYLPRVCGTTVVLWPLSVMFCEPDVMPLASLGFGFHFYYCISGISCCWFCYLMLVLFYLYSNWVSFGLIFPFVWGVYLLICFLSRWKMFFPKHSVIRNNKFVSQSLVPLFFFFFASALISMSICSSYIV